MKHKLPFYVVISRSGPNNSGHPNYKTSAIYKDGQQYFKVVDISTNKEHGNTENHVTYITEDGYHLWSMCVNEVSEQEYITNRGLELIHEPQIFN